MFEENNQEKRMNKPLIYAIAGVALLVIAVSGSAYAYFSASASSSAITGKTLDVKLTISDLKQVSAGTGELIPIYDGTVSGKETQLTKAVTSAKVTAKTDCIDNNNYTVCQVYELKINNAGSNSTKIDTTVSVSGGTNVKWAKMTDRNTPATGTGNVNLSSNGTLATNVTLGSNSTVTQYFMVYLQNTGGDQTSADSGKTISGTVTVRASTGANIEASF